MKNFLRKNYTGLIFMVIGITGGFLYWYHVGCQTGSCPITSHWQSSLLAGGVLGYLSGDLISDVLKKKKKVDE